MNFNYKKTRITDFFSWIIPIAIVIFLIIIVRQFLFEPVAVSGVSMESTYENNDRVIINKVSDVERFDVIVFESNEEDISYIKRVIGLPGDHLQYKNDTLYINGKKYEEPYEDKGKEIYAKSGVNFTRDFTLEELTGKSEVPKGMYFVLGDNRRYSSDSREFGFVKETSIQGVVQLNLTNFTKEDERSNE